MDQMKKVLSLSLAIAALASPACADDGISPINTDYLLSYPLDTLRLVANPVHWKKEDWMVAGVVTAGIGGLFLLDESINSLSKHNPGAGDTMATIFKPFGDSYYMVGASAALWAAGEATDNLRLQRVGLHGVEAILVGQLVTEGIKRIGGRSRPDSTDSAFDFFYSNSNSSDSFSSGHATTAFALATVISQEYQSDYPWVPYVAYGVATGTGLSRIMDNSHWASDVAIGAAIGIGAGLVVTKYSPFRGKGMSVIPLVSTDQVGVMVNTKF